MTETHTNGAGTSQSHDAETVSRSSAPWLDEGVSRATYYRRKQAANNHPPELNGTIKPEVEIAEPAIKLADKDNSQDKSEDKEPIAAEQITAEPKPDAAAERIKMLLDQINGRDPRQLEQQAYAKEIDAVYKFWEQSGLAPEHLQLFQSHPEYMLQLSRAAHSQAVQQHPMNTPEYFEFGKKLVFEHLDRLQEQAKQNTAVPQSAPEAPMPPNEQPPSFFAPTTAPAALTPRPQKPPQRTAHYAAPVSRQTPDSRIAEKVNDPRSVRLSPDQVEAARIAGISPAEYARQFLRMEQMKRDGSFNNQ